MRKKNKKRKNKKQLRLQKQEAAKRRPPNEISVYKPANSRPGDVFEAVILGESVADWKTIEGDAFIVYHTNDVRKGDVAHIEDKAEEFHYIGVLDMDDYYFHLEEDSENERMSFHRTQVRVTGRVIAVYRNGEPIQTTLNLRPVRPPDLQERVRQILFYILKAIHLQQLVRWAEKGGAR